MAYAALVQHGKAGNRIEQQVGANAYQYVNDTASALPTAGVSTSGFVAVGSKLELNTGTPECKHEA